MKKSKITALTLATTVAASLAFSHAAIAHKKKQNKGYEIWASDQSNSIAGETSRGIIGSYLWIWDSKDLKKQLAGGDEAKPIGCTGKHRKHKKSAGPCNVLDVFPARLKEYDSTGKFTGNRLGDLPGFGRLHGMIPDPQHKYMNINMFSPGGGYVGIVNGKTKEAVALFRITATNGTGVERSLHMSFWNKDGSALLLANLHGKVLERIDIVRNKRGRIVDAIFNQSASLGLGKNMIISDGAKAYRGHNAHGHHMVGRVAGDYVSAAFGDLTPNGNCKENGCSTGPDGALGGRANNVLVCPIVSDNNNAYITFGGGGLLIADTDATPMTIIGEYDNQVVNGAGCGGVQVEDNMWINAGASASGAGATQSTFGMYTIDDSQFSSSPNLPNTPAPVLVFKDATNTATIGNIGGDPNPNTTGQIPGNSTRRDAHGMARTVSGSHIHNADRVQNVVEVFDTETLARSTYDLTSADGQGNGLGACAAASVSDDSGLPSNDPAPDLMDTTPDGKYLVVALRGPTPVSVTHSAQGSCPGVGIIELTDDGASGRLAGVLRTTNTLDTSIPSAPGGHAYTGSERSDIHGAAIRRK